MGESNTGLSLLKGNCMPSIIWRVVNSIFAVIVLGCISAIGYDPVTQECIFNENSDACHFGLAVSVLAFVACLLFILVDFQFNNLSNPEWAGVVLKGDMYFSGVWSFLWFVTFCFLADQWRLSSIKTQSETDQARCAIAFAFFSIFSWAGLALVLLQRSRRHSRSRSDYENLMNPSYTAQYDRPIPKSPPSPPQTTYSVPISSESYQYQQPQYVAPSPNVVVQGTS